MLKQDREGKKILQWNVFLTKQERFLGEVFLPQIKLQAPFFGTMLKLLH